jgi:putative PEP-CTERM system TPR-repeat lipoprotein
MNAGLGLLALSVVACSGKTAEDYIQQAQVYIEQGDNRAAIVELKNAVQQNPRLASARFELGKIYIVEKNFNSAEKELSKALDLGYPSNEVIPLLSEALQRIGANVALADLKYETNKLTGVERLEIGYRQLQSLLQLEKNYEALDLIDELSVIESKSVYKGLIEAHRFILEEDYLSALARAEILHERAPLNRDILGFTARLYMLNGQKEQAAAMYEEYVKVASDDIELKFALANMLVELGELARATIYIDELLLLSDTNATLNHLKGIIAAANENYPDALAYSEKAIQFGLTGPRVRLIAGFAAYRLEDFNRAVNHLSIIESSLADGHPGLRILAASQLQADMGTQASEILPRLNNLTEQDANLFSRTGFKLIQEGNIEAAKEVIEQANRISVSADDLTRLGILKLSVNNIEGLLNLEQALEKAPESKSAKASLGTAYLSTGQLAKALNLAKEWQASEPNSVEGFILESEVLQRQDNYEAAKEILVKVKNSAADNNALMVALIRINHRMQDLEEATINTELLLQKEPDSIIGLASFYTIKLAQKQPKEALTRIKGAFEKSKSNQGLALLLARSALASGEIKMSLEALNSIEANRNAPSEFWSMKGTALTQDKQLDAAEKHYAYWSKLFPKQQQAVIAHVLLLDTMREYKKALGLTLDFLARKENVQLSLLQAYFYAMTNDAKNAAKTLSTIDEQYQTLPFLKGVKARIALLENRAIDAVDDALAAYEDNKNTDNLFVALTALKLTEQAKRHEELIQAHSEAFPNDMRTKLLIADGLIRTNPKDAILKYQEMLETVPNNVIILNNLAYLLMVEGNLERAEELSARGYAIQPKNVAMVDTYAQILIRQGKTAEAVEAYNLVMNDDVTNEDIVINYIHALLSNGSTVIAKRRLESREFRSPVSKVRIDELKKEFNL